jgi:hypothetical protein
MEWWMRSQCKLSYVMAAKAPIHDRYQSFVMFRLVWIPAFAGMTAQAMTWGA